MRIKSIISIAVLMVVFDIYATTPDGDKVTAKVIKQVFPTYEMGPHDPNTLFIDYKVEGLSFFRGSRSTYPYSFMNDYRPGKKDVEYEVIRLENDFVYLDIIPQLRGRIQGAVDKRNGWDFLYYNHVIKPAEIAVRSAWISGGLEYNHPQGHGYTQFNKISHDILENKDGSITVVIAEIEPVRMMKWEYEITLRPDQLYFETKGRIMSISPFKVPFLCSNNAAMHVTDETELIYPQECYASGHGFTDLKKWSEYDSQGASLNWLKETKHVVSVFADGNTGLTHDYFGCYAHDKGIDAGSVIVQDHRVAPGKKYFTWGTHPGGRIWDHYLSDKDGGYIELQPQAYFTNLGYGYAVLEPFEVKEFSTFWYPVKNTGGFVQASKEVAVNYKRLSDQKIKIDIQPTLTMPGTKVSVYKNSQLQQEMNMDMVVGEVYSKELNIVSTPDDTMKIIVVSNENRNLISYASKVYSEEPVINKISNKQMKDYTISELYSKAITDYHDPFNPKAEEYLDEIFSHDPMEPRANRLKGTIMTKRGKFEEAIKYFQKSLVVDHFEGCYEAWFGIGYAYLQSGKTDKAHEYLVQSSRTSADLVKSLYYLAQIELQRKNFHEALRVLEQVPVSTAIHPDIFNLLSYTCRKLGDNEKAKYYLDKSFEIDPMNFAGFIEKLELDGETKAAIDKINFLFDRKDVLFLGSQNYIESAIFYMDLKDYDQALKVLNIAENNYAPESVIYPFVSYFKGYCLMQKGRKEEAVSYYKKGSETDFNYVFPYHVKSIAILKDVIANKPNDAIALMYYGDLMYYLRRHDEAIVSWEESYKNRPDNFRVTRNLAISKYMKDKNLANAVKLLEESYANHQTMRSFSELEQFYKLAKDYKKLESFYDSNEKMLRLKGEYALNAAEFYTTLGRYKDAQKVLADTYYNAIEKAMGTPVRHSVYSETRTSEAESLISQKKFPEALKVLSESYEYPSYLNEAVPNFPVTVKADYLSGLAYLGNGQKSKAKQSFQKAAYQAVNERTAAVVYKAMAMKETGKVKEAELIVNKLISELKMANPKSGRYAEAGSEQSDNAKNSYIISLGYDFLGEKESAKQYLEAAMDKDYTIAFEVMYDASFIPQER
jgi:tetratricopeptide (TPR) repeat protein